MPSGKHKRKKQVMRETWAKQQIHKLLTQSFWITNNFAQNDSSLLPSSLIFSSLNTLTEMRKKEVLLIRKLRFKKCNTFFLENPI